MNALIALSTPCEALIAAAMCAPESAGGAGEEAVCGARKRGAVRGRHFYSGTQAWRSRTARHAAAGPPAGAARLARARAAAATSRAAVDGVICDGWFPCESLVHFMHCDHTTDHPNWPLPASCACRHEPQVAVLRLDRWICSFT